MKRITVVVMCMFLFFNMAACRASVSEGQKSEGTAGTAAKSSLSIYYMMNDNYISNAILEFSMDSENVKIKQKAFTVNANDDFNKTISTEVLTGRGPDIIVCDPLSDFDSINKVINSGAFADLNELIAEDKDFKLTDYNSKVISAGVLNGRREFLPLYYRGQVFYTTESILKQNDINIKDDCSIKDLNSIIESFLKNKSRKSKYLFDSGIKFHYLLNYFGDDFIDYKHKKCNFNCSDFKELLRTYKNMQPVIAPLEIEKKYEDSQTNLLKNNIVALDIDFCGSIQTFHSNNCLVNHDMGENMKIIKIGASSKDNKLRPIITDVVAIANSCKNKEAAFEFIKTLLSEKIQRLNYRDDSYNSINNPINNNALKKDIEKYSGPEGNKGTVTEFTGGGGLVKEAKSISLPAELAKRITGINENMAEPVLIDKSVKTIIYDALQDYLSGKNNEDQTAKIINDKVELFLNE